MSIFVLVVEYGSFVSAARVSKLSATMVAKHVAALESRLGTRLLSRTTRKQSLTELGKVYYDRCKALLAEVEAVDSSINQLRNIPKGTLRVTAPVTFGNFCLAPLLSAFLQQHPDVNINLSLNDRVVDLVEEGVEAAIRIGTLIDNRLIARPLRPYRSFICAAPEYLALHGTPRSPAELSKHTCLAFGVARHPNRWRLVSKGREENVRIVPRLIANSGQALREAAVAGAGIIVQPEVLLGKEIEDGTLVRVLSRWSPPEVSMHLVYAKDRLMTPKLQRFTEFVVAAFGDHIPNNE